MISVHGLIRGDELELGRDADTGGQTKYVVDLARALARHPEVERVDLVTRRVVDPEVNPDYAEPEESLGDGARIVRIDCGP
jgi:sucrose-phosphate synthase